jgi:hypothetical protein
LLADLAAAWCRNVGASWTTVATYPFFVDAFDSVEIFVDAMLPTKFFQFAKKKLSIALDNMLTLAV